jgi:plasmid stabilization system protein ParE
VPHISIAPAAARGIERCRRFLAAKNFAASKRASAEIERHFRLLTFAPEIGRPLGDSPQVRELVIAFGKSGYLARYRYDRVKDSVVITAFRHQREAAD